MKKFTKRQKKYVEDLVLNNTNVYDEPKLVSLLGESDRVYIDVGVRTVTESHAIFDSFILEKYYKYEQLNQLNKFIYDSLLESYIGKSIITEPSDKALKAFKSGLIGGKRMFRANDLYKVIELVAKNAGKAHS